MEQRQNRIVLASRSPRRLGLLQGLGFEPVVVVADVAEVKGEYESPEDYTRRLSQDKALAVAVSLNDSPEQSPWVIAADTVVVHNGRLLEKPIDAMDACRMLSALSDQWHTVYTSFAFALAGHDRCALSKTVAADVRFRKLAVDEIERYVATGEPMDKAGAYGIQAVGAALVREIRGSYFCVVGLPVCEVVEAMLELGVIDRFPLALLSGTK